jgi:hypothetical protein
MGSWPFDLATDAPGIAFVTILISLAYGARLDESSHVGYHAWTINSRRSHFASVRRSSRELSIICQTVVPTRKGPSGGGNASGSDEYAGPTSNTINRAKPLDTMRTQVTPRKVGCYCYNPSSVKLLQRIHTRSYRHQCLLWVNSSLSPV